MSSNGFSSTLTRRRTAATAADDGLVRIVCVDVETTPGEQLGQDVAGRRHALAGGSADADCEVDVGHRSWTAAGVDLRNRPKSTAPDAKPPDTTGRPRRRQPSGTARATAGSERRDTVDLDARPPRERTDLDRRAGRWCLAEVPTVRFVDLGEVGHVGHEDGGLH